MDYNENAKALVEDAVKNFTDDLKKNPPTKKTRKGICFWITENEKEMFDAIQLYSSKRFGHTVQAMITSAIRKVYAESLGQEKAS